MDPEKVLILNHIGNSHVLAWSLTLLIAGPLIQSDSARYKKSNIKYLDLYNLVIISTHFITKVFKQEGRMNSIMWSIYLRTF